MGLGLAVPSAVSRVDYDPQLASLSRWLPDQRERTRVLWDNPSRIFGFKR